tara:strand:+ start:326 stop:559 length:234 start_codon:yes stop_codon:yes gene_type:complete
VSNKSNPGYTGGNSLGSAKRAMMEVVGACIIKILKKYKNVQLNLASETTQYNLASEILDEILLIIDKKKGVQDDPEC